MTFMIGLLTIFALLHLPSQIGLKWDYLGSTKDKARIAFAVMFIISGLSHFTETDSFAQMIPPFFPNPVTLVFVSGALEVLGAVGLLIPAQRVQRMAAYAIVLLLLAVFPANIYAAISGIISPGALSSPLYLWLRLPLQTFYIGWVLWAVSQPRSDEQLIGVSP